MATEDTVYSYEARDSNDKADANVTATVSAYTFATATDCKKTF